MVNPSLPFRMYDAEAWERPPNAPTVDELLQANNKKLTFHWRCGICLTKLPPPGCQSGDYFDLQGVETGAKMFKLGMDLDIFSAFEQHRDDLGQFFYAGDQEKNGMVRCGSCHFGLFLPNYVSLSPPRQILEYILEHITKTGPGCLNLAGALALKTLPKSLQPYLYLYSLIILKEKEVEDIQILTPCLPPLSILQDDKFVRAQRSVLPGHSNAVRIFDVSALGKEFSKYHSPPLKICVVPLSKSGLAHETRYWRLPMINPLVMLACLMQQVCEGDGIEVEEECAELKLTKEIYEQLRLRSTTL